MFSDESAVELLEEFQDSYGKWVPSEAFINE